MIRIGIHLMQMVIILDLHIMESYCHKSHPIIVQFQLHGWQTLCQAQAFSRSSSLQREAWHLLESRAGSKPKSMECLRTTNARDDIKTIVCDGFKWECWPDPKTLFEECHSTQ